MAQELPSTQIVSLPLLPDIPPSSQYCVARLWTKDQTANVMRKELRPLDDSFSFTLSPFRAQSLNLTQYEISLPWTKERSEEDEAPGHMISMCCCTDIECNGPSSCRFERISVAPELMSFSNLTRGQLLMLGSIALVIVMALAKLIKCIRCAKRKLTAADRIAELPVVQQNRMLRAALKEALDQPSERKLRRLKAHLDDNQEDYI